MGYATPEKYFSIFRLQAGNVEQFEKVGQPRRSIGL
jgi:hypothetical protein